MANLVDLRSKKSHNFTANRCLFGAPDLEECNKLANQEMTVVRFSRLDHLKNLKKRGSNVQRNLFACEPEMEDIDQMVVEQHIDDKTRFKDSWGFDLDRINEIEKQNLARLLKKRKWEQIRRVRVNQRQIRKKLNYGSDNPTTRNSPTIAVYLQPRNNVHEEQQDE